VGRVRNAGLASWTDESAAATIDIPPLRDPIEAMTDSLRELDRRSNDRLDVSLVWREHDDRVLVVVEDEKTGARFTIEVRDDERALDVFHHPYAYAAHRGVDTGPRLAQLTAAA
jgi:hypothetical protein